MKNKFILSITIFLFSAVTLFGFIFPSNKTYSYVNPVQTIGENRSITELIYSRNRVELKNKIDSVIFQSSFRNFVLGSVAKISWDMQPRISIDTQFFNTEIFYGKDGSLFPNTVSCVESKLPNINTNKDSQFIFLMVPLKQEIESYKLPNYQRNNICLQNKANLQLLYEGHSEYKYIDLYELFNDKDKSYYEYGDTHWNNYGLNLVLIELLKITNPSEKFNLIDDGYYVENNRVLERLGLIELNKLSPKYKIQPIPKEKSKILILRDSFFNDYYGPKKYLKNYFNVEYLTWGEINNLFDLEFQNYDFVIFESSIDIFFQNRILIFDEKNY